MLQIRLFGAGEVRYQSQTLHGFPNKLPHLLLCYLLLQRGQSHPREQIATVFWDDYTSATSRKYLRNAIWRLRNALESIGVAAERYLTVDDEHIAFAEAGRYQLDIEEFEEVTRRYQDIPGNELTTDMAEQLAEAVSLYTGDLLEGIYEEWCLHDRERLHLLYINTLEKLMSFHTANGTYEQGITYGRQILACEETREKVHRQVMLLHWYAGDRDAAISQYRQCADVLDESLGIRPMTATQTLYQRILQHERPSRIHTTEAMAPTQRIQQALQRIQELRSVVQQADAELQALEEIVRDLALDAQRSNGTAHKYQNASAKTEI